MKKIPPVPELPSTFNISLNKSVSGRLFGHRGGMKEVATSLLDKKMGYFRQKDLSNLMGQWGNFVY